MPDTTPEINPYASLLQGEADRLKTTEAATLTTAVDTNPDQFATQRRVAGFLGYPVAAVEATPEASKKQAQVKQITQDSSTHPVLQAKYSDADFAKLAHDDSSTLGKIADTMGEAAKYVVGAPGANGGLVADLLGGAYHGGAAGAAGVFRAGTEFVAPVLDVMEHLDATKAIGGNPLRRLAEGFGMLGAKATEDLAALTPKGEGIISGGVSSGVQSLGQNLMVLPMAAVNPLATLIAMSGMQGGQSYNKAREAGVSQNVALAYGLSDAVIEYATEKIPMHALLGDIAKGASVLKTVGKQIASEVPGEQVATIMQDLNEWAVMPENKNKPFSAYLAERPAAAAQTLIATVIGIGGNVAVMKSVQGAIDNATGTQRQVDAAQRDGENLQQLFALAAQSKLRERSPRHLAEFIQEQADHTEGAPTEVFIDARVLAGEGGLLNQETLAQMFPTVDAQTVAEAVASGGDVSLPIGDLMANAAGTPLEQKLLEHLRTTPEGLSSFEAKQAQEQAAEYLQSEAARVIGEGTDATAAQQSAEAVKTAVLTQLASANRFTPEVNDAYASLVRDFYTVTASRLGITPEEMHTRYPLRVAATNPNGGLMQPAYHGTHARNIERFSTGKIGTGEGAQVYGWGMYFAGNKSVAEFYRKGVSGQKFVGEVNGRLSELASVMAADQAGEYGKYKSDAGRLARAEYDRLLVERQAKKDDAGGQTYQVEVPDNDLLLDHDAKIANQSPAVQAALAALGFTTKKYEVGYKDADGNYHVETFKALDQARRYITSNNLAAKPKEVDNNETGANVYSRLSARLGGDEAASRALGEAGIPGLRYLDQDSRGKNAADQSHNYVIFNDANVDITGTFHQSRIKQATPAVTKLLKNLTVEEQAKITDAVAARVIALMKDFPSAKEMAAVAYAGRAKRGWYAKSAQTISELFGHDAPRFAGLLAAMSPQCSVETNLVNALNTWKNWTAAGRPTSREEIVAVMGRSVQGGRGEGSVLGAWINNSVRALTHESPDQALLSGPKVNSFFKNLRGHVNEVTNDAWMANYALVEQTIFAGGMNKLGTDPGKGSGYLAMNARVREAADNLTKLTGEQWTPAEVQETIWSWAKTLYELANTATEDRSARQLVEDGALTDDLINSTPDFGSLFHDPAYAGILKEAGYGQELDAIAQRNAAAQSGQVASARGQAAPFAADAQRKFELAAARRLEQLSAARGDLKSAAAERKLEQAVEEANAGVYEQSAPGQPLDLEEPLRGLLQTVKVDGQDVTFGPFVPARLAAVEYMKAAGLPYLPPTIYAKVDAERGARIARAFTRMVDDPKDPKVKASYDAMIQETLAQYQTILATGLKVEFNDGADPYGNPRNAILDAIHNNHLYVFSTREGFGSDATFDASKNPLLQETEFTDANGKPMLANDVFRVVHDYFGHIKEGVGFRADGEENAWRAHAAMYSDLARPAMTTETRGQNSWVNFGPSAVANATANGAATIYADQKIGLLPDWVMREGATDAAGTGPARDGSPAANGGSGGVENVVRHPGGRVDVQGVHYSTGQRASLNGKFFGRGLKGAERARLDGATDPRLSDRVYLYVDEGNGIRPESGVGGVAHQVDASNLYDINANPLKLPTADANAMESAILDAGFDGYYVPKVFNNQGVAVIIGNASQNVAVKPNASLQQGPRGTFNPNTLQISLLEGADLSTFLHETGHFFLEVLADVSSQSTTPDAVGNDMTAVLKWFGVKDIAAWNALDLEGKRPFHEKFAESFEQYLFEGKAPNQELQPLFARFRSWMTNVYKSLTDFMASHDTKLSAEVRGIFDRLLATDDAIQQAETARAYAPLFKSAEQAGMTPLEWAAYQAVGTQATDKAIEKLDARSLRDMRWTSGARSRALKALQKDVAEKRKAVEAEVEAELAATPVEQARAYLKELGKGELANTVEHKAAMKAWRAQYDDAKAAVKEAVRADKTITGVDERKLEVDRRMLQWEAEHDAPQPKIDEGALDVAAELFGYTSGDEMMTAMRTIPPARQLVEDRVDQTLLERYGDLTTVQGMGKAADEAVHNEARGRFIATGLKSLIDGSTQNEKAPGEKRSVNVLVKAARQFAESLVARRAVRDLSAAKHLAAETRAGKAALKAVASGDTKLAIASQRDQLLNHFAARMTAAASEEVEKRIKYLRGFETNTTLPPEYRDQIDQLLERFDLRKTPLKQVDKRKSLLAWVETQRAIGVEPELPEGLLNEAQRKNYRDMSVEEFRGLVDTVKQIEHLGRLKDKLLTAKDQRDFETTRDAIAKSIEDNAGKHQNADTRTPTTNLGRWWQSIKGFGAAHIKAATYARVLDGGKDGGPMWEYFVRGANVAGDTETTMRAQATKALTDILAPFFDSGKLGGKGVFFPSVKKSFNRESILTIALNTGNEGNMQRLLGGEGWTLDQLQPILDTMTAKDWQVVQGIWNHFESYKKAIGAKSMRVYGTEPDWIDPAPRVITLADGTTFALNGGYYPIKYDPSASVRAEEHADAEGAKRQLQGAYGAATTRRSFTKTRAEEVTGRPLLYTLSGVYSGVNDVIHDLSWHEWLIDTNRLLKSQAIDGAVRTHYGPEVVRQFKSWRDAVAEGDSASQDAIDTALSKLRQGVSIAGLGFNVMSALMQPLGMTQSIVRIGPKAVARGILQYLANPVKATHEVQAQSEYMANRGRTRFRELNELKNKVQGETKAREAISTGAYFLMMQCQQMVDVPTWLGAYEKAIADGNNQERAVALSDQAVIDAQGGGQTKDLSAIERGGQAAKLFTVFYSFMNTAQNLGYASRHTNQGYAKASVDALLLYVAPAVLGALLKSALTPGDSGDDKDWKTLARKLVGEQLSFLLGLFVVGREFAEAGKAVAGLSDHPRDYQGPAGLRAIGDATVLAKQVNQGVFDEQFRKALINMMGDLFALPSAQVNRTITGIEALKAGDTKNPAAVLLGFQKPKP